MSYLAVSVVFIGIVCVANLLLMVAMARRFRELRGVIARPVPPGSKSPAYRLPPGSQVGDFSAVTIAGDSVALRGLSDGRALVGFFSSGCEPCHEQLAGFAEVAKTIPGGRTQVLAVLSGRADRMAELVDRLDGIASIVLEEAAPGVMGPVARAFSAYGRPSYYLLAPGGTVESSAPTIAALAADLATSSS